MRVGFKNVSITFRPIIISYVMYFVAVYIIFMPGMFFIYTGK